MSLRELHEDWSLVDAEEAHLVLDHLYVTRETERRRQEAEREKLRRENEIKGKRRRRT